MSYFHTQYKAPFLLIVQISLILSSVTWQTMAGFWLLFVFPVFFALSGAILTHNKRWFYTYLSFSALSIIFDNLGSGPVWGFLRFACLSTTFYLLLKEIVRHSFFKPEVPQADRILAGINGYLAIGFFWFLLLNTTLKVTPGSIQNLTTSSDPNISDLLYFTFVTLTTLGYGDILPVTPLTKMIVIFTSLSGALYLAIFISALISGTAIRKES